ncbi:MAG: pantoate--beta-alanine ligase [Bacteroidales bacterium]|nr:pantoate--beta-alanine ligase [Bacteroidales bacterium]
MKIFKTIPEIKNHLKELKKEGFSIGFVPTMGALHKGHISLIRKACLGNDKVVCSIFVNPIQFTNKDDLLKYPRKVDSDFQMLRENNCDILFFPDTKEMYPEVEDTIYDFGHLDNILEGKFRPGHFNGVAIVVKKFLEIIEPDKAYFGKKDYQQLAVIQALVKNFNIPVEIIPCPTFREDDGLAMSSRNLRLSENERSIAPHIHKVLLQAKTKAATITAEELKTWVISEFSKYHEFKLEYFELADPDTLLPVKSLKKGQNCIALIAVYLGNIRLIDNIEIFY